MLEHKQTIQNLVLDGNAALKQCINQGSEHIKLNSHKVTNVTGQATERGQDLLDALYECSRKPGLQVITCYKDIIAQDVVPVKMALLGAIRAHTEGHLRTIRIRNEANACVDDALISTQLAMQEALELALKCH